MAFFFFVFFCVEKPQNFRTHKTGAKKKKKKRNSFSLIISFFVVVSYIEAKAWQESPTVRTQKNPLLHSTH